MKKYPYFENGNGLAFYEENINEQLNIIANRFIGANPPLDYKARVVSHDGFINNSKIDLSKKYPQGVDGYVLVCGYIKSDDDKIINLSIFCQSPTKIYANGEEIFKSDIGDEFAYAKPKKIKYKIKKGKTLFTLLIRRTIAGFGCDISLPRTVLSPFKDREGISGWVYSDIIDKLDDVKLEDIIYGVANDDERGIDWFPKIQKENIITPQKNIFECTDGKIISWSKINTYRDKDVLLNIDSKGNNKIYIDNNLVKECNEGIYKIIIKKSAFIYIESKISKDNFGANINIDGGCLEKPFPVDGLMDNWLYVYCSANENFNFSTTPVEKIQNYHWRANGNNLFIRRFYEGSYGDIWHKSSGGTSFGRWDYPIGVTLQGLLCTANTNKNNNIFGYANKHILQCVNSYNEAKRTKNIYGETFLPSLIARKTLDDFGAMAASMLECSKNTESNIFRIMSDEFFSIIKNDIAYLDNGAYYRRESDTLWADDLYMGTSFLSRYYEKYGSQEALDLAATQFLAFAELLYIDEYKIFSHVYDVKRKVATGIPWGRGNGWVIYSLVELLERMPKEHKEYNKLMKLFGNLSQGFLALQDKKGYWHQVLTDLESYEETSCTAMFVYAYSKGVKNGWYKNSFPYEVAATLGWKAISSYSVDLHGNVHAVCRGSGFSFTAEYYKDDLFWVTNDNHGTGIVLLAGSEFLSMKNNI